MEKVIIYRDSELLLVKDADGSYRLPYADQVPAELKADESANFRFPGAEDSATYLAVPLLENYVSESGEPLPADYTPEDIGLERVGLRESWGLLPEADYRAAAKGAELLNWSSSTRFCSVCGAPMVRATEISKRCSNPDCGREVFPSLWPAIVVLVIKESPDGDHTKDEALLVHARNLKRPNVQTLVAGFVETGESLEECVAREVKEETSLEITDIRYEGSQSWPFPSHGS